MTLFFQNKTIKSSTRGTVELFYSTNKKLEIKEKRENVEESRKQDTKAAAVSPDLEDKTHEDKRR